MPNRASRSPSSAFAPLGAASPSPSGDDAADASPWTYFEAVAAHEKLRVRVATTMEDAEGIYSVLGCAWRVDAAGARGRGEFADARAVFRTLVAPAARATSIRRLDALSLIAEENSGRIVATAVLLFDHARRQIELGRGAVAHYARGRSILNAFLPPMRHLLEAIPDYARVAEANFLSRAVGRTAEALGAPVVAILPSSFAIDTSRVSGWLRELSRAHGPELAHALLERSERTGLGRFAAIQHLYLPAEQEAYKPVLDAKTYSFYQHTCAALGECSNGRRQQNGSRPMRRVDRRGAGTRLLIDVPPDFDPASALDAAASAGFETLHVQHPCDAASLALGERLRAAGGMLSGVFPDAFGAWHAAYTFFSADERYQRARAGFERLLHSYALSDSHLDLLRCIVTAATR
ncbi:hypothetical protein [Haliangium ochraceum]|uniref:Uncharacterized protein n=1 Tax=Haliangium ochraceum (strain DSM 14365 / JCM 11303 / SMP-2) TaxID=502025 RepID=D0LX23_HALO1|nr:hypothetical protein [Haliangium ochraceum]ACY14270.1 hypothetical protein Hoch_1721 [Haliangium ochraceum DSM 14365]